MPNVMTVLKQEIARISKKEARSLVNPVRKSAVSSRTAVADLKRRAGAMEKELKRLRAAVERMAAAQPAAAIPESGAKARITAKGMRSLRKRLGLSAGDFGKLLGITAQAVYSQEKGSGALRVRAATRQAILAIRGIGARDAKKRLAELPAPKKAAARRRKQATRK
jgi:DNA-binding transcriptional regulator YiaG